MSLVSLAPLTTTSGSTPTSAAGSTHVCATKTTLDVWTRSRWDDMRRTWFVSSLSPTSPYTTPGLNTTAISRRRGRCSFRRIAPLVLLGNRRRCSQRPAFASNAFPSLPRQARGCTAMQWIRPRRVFDKIAPRGRTSCVALAARSSKRRAPRRVPHMKDAQKYGLRTLHKAHWDALNEEYIVYKQSSWTRWRVQRLNTSPRDRPRAQRTHRPPPHLSQNPSPNLDADNALLTLSIGLPRFRVQRLPRHEQHRAQIALCPSVPRQRRKRAYAHDNRSRLRRH